MAKQKHSVFKEQLKQWMADNSDDYEEFEDMMNECSSQGYNSIMLRAMALMPKFEKAVKRKHNCDNNIDISDIIEMAKEEKLAEKLLSEFDSKESDNFIPAMLSWLYYSRSFENMLESGEDILKLPQTSFFQKIYITFGMKLIVSRSKKLGLRTKEDWERYNKLRSIITGDKVIDWVMDDTEIETKIEVETENMKDITDPQQPINDIISFANMLTLNRVKKEILISIIADYLDTRPRGKNIALMILALQELDYLPQTNSYATVFRALRRDFNAQIGSDSGILRYIKWNIAVQFKKEVSNLVRYFKVN